MHVQLNRPALNCPISDCRRRPAVHSHQTGFSALSNNEFTGLTLTAPDGTAVQLEGPPAVGTPHAGWALGALMAMQAGQLLAFWGVFYVALAVVGALRRL